MKKLIATPDVLRDLFLQYQAWVKAHPIKRQVYRSGHLRTIELRRPLTMVGFECFLSDLGRINHLKDYMSNRDGRYSDYALVCRLIKTAIRADQIEGGLVGIYNPSITARITGLSKNIHAVVPISHARIITDK